MIKYMLTAGMAIGLGFGAGWVSPSGWSDGSSGWHTGTMEMKYRDLTTGRTVVDANTGAMIPWESIVGNYTALLLVADDCTLVMGDVSHWVSGLERMGEEVLVLVRDRESTQLRWLLDDLHEIRTDVMIVMEDTESRRMQYPALVLPAASESRFLLHAGTLAISEVL